MSCYIGLGSNLGDSFQYLQNAVTVLHQHSDIAVTGLSDVYQSKPHGLQEQDDYLNAVVEITADLSPNTLLRVTQSIENKNKRLRTGEHWGARTLDLDILLFDDVIVHEDHLIIPHPWICQREFVLHPLRDIVGTLTFPNGKTLQACIDACPENEMMKTSLHLTL